MHVHLTTKHWTKAGHPNLAMAITVTLTMATIMTIRDINIMAMMAMATWVKSPCLTRWRGPPESPLELELDRGCDIKKEGLFVWMANGYLLLLVIVVFFCSYNLILLVVYLASGPSVQSRYAQNLIGRFERNKKVDMSPFLWQQLDIVRRMSSCRWWLHQPASEILKIHG